MTRTRTSFTVVFTFDCYVDDPSSCEYPSLPFPDFDDFRGQSFPVFEITQEIKIDQTQLDLRMAEVYGNHNKMILCGSLLTALAFAGFTLASLFYFIYFMNNPIKQKEEDVANKARINKVTRHQEFQLDFDESENVGFLVE